MPKLLTCVAKDDSILREVMPEVQDFKDPLLHEIIEDMCYSILPQQLKAADAAYESAAGMAANQWGIRKRIFIFTPDGSNTQSKMEVMINPSYIPHLNKGESEPTLTAAYEGCFSVPLTTGVVQRYETILATYYTPLGEKMERVMEGWEARVFQHETDHLDGKLFDGLLDQQKGPPCMDRIIFQNKAEMDLYWQEKVRPSRES